MRKKQKSKDTKKKSASAIQKAANNKKATDYEKLAQSVCEIITKADPVEFNNNEVCHNVRIKGDSGATHQIDVMWKYQYKGKMYCVLVECKHYNSRINKALVCAFATVCNDIPNSIGLFVTTREYQQGAKQIARQYGIPLLLLYVPVQKISLKMEASYLVPTSGLTAGVRVQLYASNEEEEQKILEASTKPCNQFHGNYMLRDKNGQPRISLYSWALKYLDSQETGGSLDAEISLGNLYICLNEGTNDELLAKIRSIDCGNLRIERLEMRSEIVGEEIIDVVLKNTENGDIKPIRFDNKRLISYFN